MLAAARYSKAKSRSLTESRLFAVGRSKPGPVEAQGLRRHLAVDGERRPRKRRRAQRAFVHPAARILEPRPVAGQHLDIGQHVMPPGHRLCGLEVVRPRLGLRDESLHQPGQRLDRLVALVAHPQAEVDRDLVVPAAPGVQALARLADPFGQPGLDVEVDVLKFGRKGETARFDL